MGARRLGARWQWLLGVEVGGDASDTESIKDLGSLPGRKGMLIHPVSSQSLLAKFAWYEPTSEIHSANHGSSLYV